MVPNCVPVSEELTEENTPTNPALWSRVKAQAKSKFDVYPSAYANGWAAKEYKAKGGGWKKKAKTQKEHVVIEDSQGNPVVEIIDLIKPEPMKGIAAREETDLTGPQWNKMVSNRQLKDIKKERNAIHKEFQTSDRKERQRDAKAAKDNEKALVGEDLRKWFGDGPKGGWDRYNTKGEKVGKCAREDKDGDGKGDGPKPKCLSNEKASKMSKDEIASSVKAKRAKDGDADRKGKPINVKNKGLKEFKDFLDEAAPALMKHNLKRIKDVQKMKQQLAQQQAMAAAQPQKPVKEGADMWKPEGTAGSDDQNAKIQAKAKKKLPIPPKPVKEVLDMKTAEMGDVVKDFYKSDAPQFKGKSKEKRREMAIAAKLQANEEHVAEAAWTKKAGQNKEGGLNEKGRKSYERENPGSDLKRPSKEPGNKRRKSFCARMKGMRKRQKPENNTGDDRLSKSLRAWNC